MVDGRCSFRENDDYDGALLIFVLFFSSLIVTGSPWRPSLLVLVLHWEFRVNKARYLMVIYSIICYSSLAQDCYVKLLCICVLYVYPPMGLGISHTFLYHVDRWYLGVWSGLKEMYIGFGLARLHYHWFFCFFHVNIAIAMKRSLCGPLTWYSAHYNHHYTIVCSISLKAGLV